MLDTLLQSQRERIAHIDFVLLFKGQAVRADLTERFNIAPPQATKDFTLYRSLAPENIQYDAKRRMHLRTQGFKPLFNYDLVRTLSTLSQGYGDGFTGPLKPPFACEAPYHLNTPDLMTVARITEAIYKQCPLMLGYISLSGGESKRELVPHTLVDNGLRWHVRGFDRKSGEFRDFVLTRIKSARVLAGDTIVPHEQREQDRQWNRYVELELTPHPRLKHPEAIALEYGMKNSQLTMELRAANAGYLLRLWNVDCSPDASLKGSEYHLWLGNRQALYGVDNLTLAPGYTD